MEGAMIISRTPLRISFAGGGSDLSAYYRHEPGAVVSVSIDKYIYINVNAKFDNQIRASYSITEIVDRAEDLRHQLIREALWQVGRDRGIEITSISDIPSQGTGLGSSSTYTVGLLNALYAFTGRFAGADRLAREACQIEIERCGEPIGKQDQYIAAYGGLQFIQFNPDEGVFVDPVICRPQTKAALEERLLMLYTGATRATANVLREQRANTESDGERRAGLRRMVQLAHELRAALIRDDLGGFGEALHEGWMRKRELASGITNPQIDDWYERGRAAGASGGKILGAGGGGFLLLYASTERHEAICAALPELRHVPVQFAPQGSKIIYVEDE
jgi:D-glycero-alpha-D-manno-heptose-7-phosphate kinase